jgi:hypothetical protein
MIRPAPESTRQQIFMRGCVNSRFAGGKSSCYANVVRWGTRSLTEPVSQVYKGIGPMPCRFTCSQEVSHEDSRRPVVGRSDLFRNDAGRGGSGRCRSDPRHLELPVRSLRRIALLRPQLLRADARVLRPHLRRMRSVGLRPVRLWNGSVVLRMGKLRHSVCGGLRSLVELRGLFQRAGCGRFHCTTAGRRLEQTQNVRERRSGSGCGRDCGS